MIAFIRMGIDRLGAMPRLHWWAVLMLAAVGTRLAWSLALQDRTPQFDEVRYVAHAIDIMHGRGYVDSLGRATADWPVGYPAAMLVANVAIEAVEFRTVGP